jgi:hypothetical protein
MNETTYTILPVTDGQMQMILRSDGAYIPSDPGNMDYQAYLTWVAAGNTAPPAQQG